MSDFILDSILKSFVVLVLKGVVIPVRLAWVLLKFRYISYCYSLLFEVLQSTHYCTFFVDIIIDRVDSLLESFLREKEVDSSLFSSSRDSSLGISILNIIHDEGLGLYKRRSFEESNSLKDLFCFRIKLDRVET